MHFFCFLNIFLAAKLSKWWLFWVQNENGRGGLDFCATTFFFSKINVTFLDVWMILIELFDISVSFRFQNFPRTNFSRYGGLYGLGMDFLIDGQVILFWPDQHEAATPFTKIKDLVYFAARIYTGNSKYGPLLCL